MSANILYNLWSIKAKDALFAIILFVMMCWIGIQYGVYRLAEHFKIILKSNKLKVTDGTNMKYGFNLLHSWCTWAHRCVRTREPDLSSCCTDPYLIMLHLLYRFLSKLNFNEWLFFKLGGDPLTPSCVYKSKRREAKIFVHDCQCCVCSCLYIKIWESVLLHSL